MTSLTSRPGASLHASPYELVAHSVKSLRRTKRELLTASRLLEHEALTSGAHTVLVTFQDRQHFTAASRAAYAALARSGATVYAFARGLVSDYTPASEGLTTVALLPDDPVVSEWDIVVLTASGGTAFLARDLAPAVPVEGPDMNRAFAWTRTDDPKLVTQAADALLARVP